MSCPPWFPSTLLRSPGADVAVGALMIASGLVGPVPGLSLLVIGAAQGIQAGSDLAHSGCDVEDAACRWCLRTEGHISRALDARWLIDGALALAGAPGMLAEAWALLERAQRALAEGTRACEAGEMADPVVDDGGALPLSGPMLEWARGTPPPQRLSQQLSHAYQQAAEASYADDPTVNLRPWLVMQANVDLDYLEDQLRRGLPAGGVIADLARANIVAAHGQLANWLEAAEAPPAGGWSRSTLRRVLRSSEIQRNLPVVPVVDGVPQPGSSGGGGGAIALLGLAAAAGVALLGK